MYRYILIGAGGTGSAVIAPALAYLYARHQNENESWEFFIVDGDNYEYKNLERQLFDPSFVGQNKANALATMYSRYPVTPIAEFVGKEDIDKLIEEHSVVFLGVDNYSVRSLVEHRASKLKNVVIINAGNEKSDGTVQIWVREDGKNLTPPISFCHPEIQYAGTDDRSAMTCAQAAALPGGEQLIIANFSAAQGILHALWRYHTGEFKNGWTESRFDLAANSVEFLDMRARKGWKTFKIAAPTNLAKKVTEGSAVAI